MSNKKHRSKSNFIVQGSILAAASIVVRMIGLLYRIPVTRILGPIGNSYYSAAYEVYSMMLLISSFSLPLAVSKLVSASVARGQIKNAYKIFKCSFVFAFVSGGLAALLVYFGAGFFSEVVVSTPESKLALQVLAPTILIVALMGCIRGYFQGLNNMEPTAISQIVEQIINAIVSIVAAYLLFDYGAKITTLLDTEAASTAAYAYGAAGSTLGTGVGALAGLLLLLFLVFLQMGSMKRRIASRPEQKEESTARIYYLLLITIAPVILSTAIYNLSGIVDQGIFKHLLEYKKYESLKIDELWGVFSGEYKLLTNVPIAIASAMASACVPRLIGAKEERNRKKMRKITAYAIRFVMLVSIPCAVGLTVLAEPILTMLFGAKTYTALSTNLLRVGSISVVLYSFSTLTNGILQGMNKMKLPVVHSVISLILHIILLVVLLMVGDLNIYAVVIANIFFAFLMCVLNMKAIKRYLRYRQEIYRTFVLPFVASVIMGVVAVCVYNIFMLLVKSNTVATLFACAVAVVVYGVLILALKVLNEEELLKLPKGKLLLDLAIKLHLM